MGRVKAYSLSGRFVVQFYDSGNSRSLNCPHCSWKGSVELAEGNKSDCHEQSCKQCGAVLAMVSSSSEQYSESQAIFQ